MAKSIHIVHYKITIGNNVIDGNATTIHSDPACNPTEAGETLMRSIKTTAPNAEVVVQKIVTIDQNQYDFVVKLFTGK